jgi:hypothetical protein
MESDKNLSFSIILNRSRSVNWIFVGWKLIGPLMGYVRCNIGFSRSRPRLLITITLID